MTLPEVSSLARVDDATLARLRARFAELGLVPKNLEPIVLRAGGIHPILRRPALLFHLRREKAPFALVARALMFADPVAQSELEAALPGLVGPLLDAGLLAMSEEGILSPFAWIAIGGFYLVADELAHGGDAVMGLGPATIALATAAAPAKRISSALDLGCGAGTIALVLSLSADRVVATDVNPRALELTRFNARLNGVSNVEVREGSVFEPVAGERFDLIASQPPFVPAIAGAGGSFMSGGPRGDEIASAVLKGLGGALSPNGRAVVITEWGHGHGMVTAPERVRAAVGEARLDVIVFQLDPSSVDTHAVEYAAGLHPELGPAFESDALRRREHCAELGYEVMAPTIVAIAAAGDRPPRFDVVPAGALGRIAPNARRIDRLLRGRALVAKIDSLLAAKLRMVDGVVLREEQVGPGAHVESTIAAVLPPAAMSDPVRLSPLLLRLASIVHETHNVRAGIDLYRQRHGIDDPVEKLTGVVGNAVLTGLLEIAD